MKAVVLGTVTLNGGDAAINRAQRVILESRWPGIELVCSDTQPVDAGRYSPHERFVASYFETFIAPGLARVPRRLGRLRPVVRRRLERRTRRAAARLVRDPSPRSMPEPHRAQLELLATADLVVYCGGTSLTPNYNLDPKLFDMELALALGRPLVFMQQSAGPFQARGTRRRLARVFSAAKLVILRDDRSLGYVRELASPASRTVVLPDTVFALAPDRLPPRAPRAARQRVAISVRRWKFFRTVPSADGDDRFVSAIRQLVCHLVRERQVDVEFTSTCQGRPEYWIDDSAYAAEIADGLPDDVRQHVVVDRAARTPEEIIEHLSAFDAMVSTRLHGAILAVCAGVPTLAIAYEYKTLEVWEQLGLGHYVEDIEELDGQRLIGSVDRLLEHLGDVREQLAIEVPRLREGALSAATLIAEALDAGPPAAAVPGADQVDAGVG